MWYVFVVSVVYVAMGMSYICGMWDMCRRSLAAQQRARAKEVLAQNKSMQTTMAIGRRALQVLYLITVWNHKNTRKLQKKLPGIRQ